MVLISKNIKDNIGIKTIIDEHNIEPKLEIFIGDLVVLNIEKAENDNSVYWQHVKNEVIEKYGRGNDQIFTVISKFKWSRNSDSPWWSEIEPGYYVLDIALDIVKKRQPDYNKPKIKRYLDF